MHQILVVEDAPEFQLIISRTLSAHKITMCGTFAEAQVKIRNVKFDLILADINLPDGDGYSLLGEIQNDSLNQETPVLCLTGRKEITDKVTAFSLGADDYITKPFDPIELRARVEAKLIKGRRTSGRQDHLTVGQIEVDLARHRVRIHSEGANPLEAVVTQTEFKILVAMARRPDQVFTRDQLLVAAWGDDARVLERVVDVHVCSLRKKLGECSIYIKAVPGVGYKISPGSDRKVKKSS